MKKFLYIIAALAMIAVPAFAAMDDVTYSLTQTRHLTNSAAYTLRGQIESIYVDVAANTTNTILVTSSQGTILTKSTITADTQFFPRVAAQTTAGAAYTYSTAGSLDTVTVTSAQSVPIAVAGPVTVALFSPNALTTNSATVTVILNQ